MFAGEYNILNSAYQSEYLNAYKHAKIVHYAGRIKPWNLECLTGATEFWSLAKKTAFFDEIKDRFIKSKEAMYNNVPLKNIEKNSNIVLYGAGGKGRELREILVHEQYCNIVLWVDENAKSKFPNYDIHLPEEIINYVYDKIVIAIENENVADNVMKELIDNNIDKNKIIWAFHN